MIARIARLAATALLAVTALLLGLAALMTVATAGERVREDQAYYTQFRKAAAAVERFRAAHQRLPSLEEQVSLLGLAFSKMALESYDPEDTSFRDRLAQAPTGSFVLSFWRGEWFEHYASWDGRTTLLTSLGRYAEAFRSQIAMYVVVALAAALGAWLVRPGHARRS